jgi:hypothetical protein
VSGVLAEERVLDRTSDEGVILAEEGVLDRTDYEGSSFTGVKG